MMKYNFKRNLNRIISGLLAVIMMITLLPTDVFAAEVQPLATPSVEIVSFNRGAQEDLRSSELLEARVTGYEGNVQDLYYKWTNGLGTKLYIYNSHNMYGINNTSGEIEITKGNNRQEKGFAWAAVYGAEMGDDYEELAGTVKVEVFEMQSNGKLKEICEDSHTGTNKKTQNLFWVTYSDYKGFIPPALDEDVENVSFGIFEGDTRQLTDLLGESSILHITCTATSTSAVKIASGQKYISLESISNGYEIKGIQPGSNNTVSGDASLTYTIKKENCKFHQYDSATATTTVYVYKRPTATVSTTYITVGNLDDRCTYTINGSTGIPVYDSVDKTKIVGYRFEGLTPNTKYQIVAEGKAGANEDNVAYAYIYATTLPVYTGKVRVMLNGSYDSSTHDALSGTPTDIEVVVDGLTENASLYLKKVGSNNYIQLPRTAEGEYSTTLDNGDYNIYIKKGNTYELADHQLIVMNDDNRTRYLFYYSVTYTDEYDVKLANKAVEYYHNGHAVDVWLEGNGLPTKDGYIFIGWQDQDGNNYLLPEYGGTVNQLTGSISKEYRLKPIWSKNVNVYVDIELDHINEDNHNNSSSMNDVSFVLMQRRTAYGNYIRVGEMDIKGWEYSAENTTYDSEYFVGKREFQQSENVVSKDVTKYISKSPEAKRTGVIASSVEVKPTFVTNERYGGYYTLDLNKTNYVVVDEDNNPTNGYSGITVTISETTGDVYIKAKLQYVPNEFDLQYSVKIADEDKTLFESLPEKFKPVAANVKITSYYNSPYDGEDKMDWFTITQHAETYERLDINKVGNDYIGSGSYAVVKTDGSQPYYYRFEVISYVLGNGTRIEVHDKNNAHTIYESDGGRYVATLTADIEDGVKPSNHTALEGAYYNEAQGKQIGTLCAEIKINTYDITFQTDGGQFKDGTTADKTVKDQLIIPDLSQYTVTKTTEQGEYAFDGWYVVKDNVMINQKIESNDELTEPMTVRAKWIAPVNVEGNVYIAGFYGTGANKQNIYDYDRIKTVKVQLQEIKDNGYPVTVKEQSVSLNYGSDDYGKGSYSFAGIINDGRKYRVLLNAANYAGYYQNEPESIESKENFSSYSNAETEYIAIFESSADTTEEGKNTATINIYGNFEPTSFDLQYKIDATEIASGYRPKLVETLVLYYDQSKNYNYPQQWKPISQMEDSASSYVGQNTTGEFTANGVEEQSYSVWNHRTDGHSLYEYAIRIQNYIAYNGTAKEPYEMSQEPFSVIYNTGAARFDPLATGESKQTQLLTATLKPNRYGITYQLNAGDDVINGMDVYPYEYYWSYGVKLPDEKPVREGYTFLGWKEVDTKDTADLSDDEIIGDYVEEILPSSHKNITLRAMWQANSYPYTIKYFYDGVEKDSLRVTGTAAYGARIELKAETIAENADGHALDGVRYSDDNSDGSKHVIVIGTNGAANLLEVHYIKKLDIPYTVKYYREKTDGTYEELKVFEHQHRNGKTNSLAKAHVEKYGEDYAGEKGIALKGYVINDEKSTSYTENGTRYNYTILIDGENTANNVIKLYYDIAQYNYTVQYYYGNVLDEDKTETGSADYGTIVKTYENKTKDGYQTTPIRVDEAVIGTDPKLNIVKVYYAPREDIKYKTVYYAENSTGDYQPVKIIENNGTFGEMVEVEPLVNGSDYLDNDLKSILTGYVLDYTNPALAGETVSITLGTNEEQNVISLYYKRGEFDYRVEFYKEGQTNPFEVVNKGKQKLGTPISVTANEIAEKMPAGYKHKETIGATVILPSATQNVIKVYYTPQTDVPYWIEYYREKSDGSYELVYTDKDEKNKGTYGQIVSVRPQELGVYYSGSLGEKLTGYIYTTTAQTVESTKLDVPNGGTPTTLKLFYKRNSYAWSVNYYKQGETTPFYTQDKKTELFGNKVSVTAEEITARRPVGYKGGTATPEQLTIGTNPASNVINVTYTEDRAQTKTLSYTVQHVYGNVLDATVTQVHTKEVWINDGNLIDIVVNSLNEKQKEGYRYKETTYSNAENITDGKVLSGTVITLNYEDIRTTYTVEHYKENPQVPGTYVKVADDIEVINCIKGQMVTATPKTTAEYVGYLFDGTIQGTVLSGEVPETGSLVLKLYYKKDITQTKSVYYKVQHLYEGANSAENKILFENTYETQVWVNNEAKTIIESGALEKATYDGYVYQNMIPSNIKEGDEVASGTTIVLKYVEDTSEEAKKTVSYTVKYYLDGVEQENAKETYTARVWMHASNEIEITELEKKEFPGYEYSHTSPAYVVGSKVVSGQEIGMYYTLDPDAIRTINYTVEHIIDGNSSPSHTYVYPKNVHPTVNTLEVTSASLTENTYVGYTCTSITLKDPSDKTIEIKVGDIVQSGAVIVMKYTKDDSQTKKISYTVKHMHGTKQLNQNDIIISETVWVNAPSKLTVTEGSIHAPTYEGYKYQSTVGLIEGATQVDNGTVIVINYVKDESKTKTLKYTVKHVTWDGDAVGSGKETEQASNTYTAEVWMHDPQTEISVNSSNYAERSYLGYQYASMTISNNDNLSDGKVLDGTVITLNYVKNLDAKKEVGYTVRYFKNGVEDTTATIVRKKEVWINDDSLVAIESEDIQTEKYGDAYKLASISPDVRGAGSAVADKTVITLYFVTDESVTTNVKYTVKHVIDNGTTEKEMAVEEHIITIPEADKDKPFGIIAGTLDFNFYKGYKKNGEITGTAGYNSEHNTVTDGTVITIIYRKDDAQKKELSYIVRHKIGEKVIDEFSNNVSVWVNADNEINVISDHVANQTEITNPKADYKGYKLGHYQIGGVSVAKPTTVESGTVITVTYVVDTEKLATNVYTVKHVVYNSETVDESAVKEEKFVDKFYETVPTALDTQTLTVKTGSLEQKDYIGYMHSITVMENGTEVEEKDVVPNNSVILIKYVKNPKITKELSYTVKHLLGGVERKEDTQTHKENVWIHADDTLTVKEGTVTPKDYLDSLGYEYVGIDPAGLVTGSVVNNGLVIELNYIKDLTKTKELKYTVKHVYKEGDTEVELIAPQVYKSVVHLSDPDTISVQSGSLDWKSFAGYSGNVEMIFTGNSTNSESLLTNNTVVTLVYKKNKELEKTVYLTVKHDVGGTIRYIKEHSENVWAGGPDQITVKEEFLTKTPYADYRFDHYDPANISVGDKLSSGATITLHYVSTKANYKVEHYIWDSSRKEYADEPAVTEELSATIGTTVTANDQTTGIFAEYMVNPNAANVRTGKVLANGTLVLELYYDLDVIGGDLEGNNMFDDPDGIPDKYQAIVVYQADPQDKVQGITRSKEVITIYDSTNSTKWASGNDVTTKGTIITPREGYAIRYWTFNDGDSETEVVNETNNILPSKTIFAEGGKTYTYTAYIVPKTSLIVPKYATYKVEYYKWDSSKDDYVLQTGDTKTLVGEIGSIASVDIGEERVKYKSQNTEKTNYTLNLQESVINGTIRIPSELEGQLDVLTLKLYYDIDKIGGGTNPDEPDEVPDKYQATIHYKVTPEQKGTLSRTKEVVTITGTSGWLQTGRVYIRGSKVIPDPEYALEYWTFDGFEVAADNILPALSMYVEGGQSYTYTANLAKKQVNYKVVHYKWNDAFGIYQEAESSKITSTVGEKVTATAKSYPGYVYNHQISTVTGVVTLPTAESRNDSQLVLTLYYDVDKIGGGTDLDESDNIPDKYQVTILYQADPADKAESISLKKEVLTIFDSQDSTKWAQAGSVEASGTAVTPNVKYKVERWTFNDGDSETDVANATSNSLVSQNISVVGGKTYIYCAKLVKALADYKVEHYKWNSEQNSYELIETENYVNASVNTTVTAVPKLYEGFVLNPQAAGYKDTGNVEIDDSLVLKLYYDTDANEDSVPDIYQVLIIYEVNPEGVATLEKTRELLTIRPNLLQRIFKTHAGWLVSGSVEVQGTAFTAANGYRFVGWTDQDGNAVTFPTVLRDVNAGETYVFKANFEKIIISEKDPDHHPTEDDKNTNESTLVEVALAPNVTRSVATGDSANAALMLALAAVSGIVITVSRIASKRKKDE